MNLMVILESENVDEMDKGRLPLYSNSHITWCRVPHLSDGAFRLESEEYGT